MPFYYYHIPVMTGVKFPMKDFLPLVKKEVPNFSGVKFTDENLMDFGHALSFGKGSLSMLFGRDEMMLSSLVMGAEGAVGSTYNYIAPIFTLLMEEFAKGNIEKARALQEKANAIIEVMISSGGLAAGKAIMRMVGINCGPVRLPLSRIS